ncbi:DHH family phosphoesterase [bacterium]|nr:DHH family phosphoesterase [bacterium]
MQNHKDVSEKIYQQIEKSKNILLVSHQKPDGDTLGSNLALLDYLLNKNKQVTSFCLDSVPQNYQFLPHSHLISNDHKIFTKKYDTVIVLDSGSLDYAGVDNLITAIPKKFVLINIDHHASNPGYGDVNLVFESASSTAEIIYRLLKDWDVDWTIDMATALACGLVTDTGGFKNPATSYQCLSATASLVQKGAKTHNIIQATLNRTEINSLKLWGRALERLKKIEKYNIIYTWITQQDFIECQVDETATEGIANFLHVLKDGKIIMVLRETTDQQIKGSLQTTTDIDLTKLATAFGGGGHKKAAGFSLPGKLVYDNNKLRIE